MRHPGPALTIRLDRARRTLRAFALACSLLASGCNKPRHVPMGADGGAAALSASLTAEQAARVLARVGDRVITLGDYAAALEHMDQFARLRYQSAERRKELLNEMIHIELLAQEATAKGYDRDARTQQELRAVLRDAMLAEARSEAQTPAAIPAREVRVYYDAHRAEYRDPERRRIACIVLNTEAAARQVVAGARKAVTPEQWGELVRANSVDVQARTNVPPDLAGDFGFVSPSGDPRGDNARVPEPVRSAAFTIAKVGDVAEHPVAAQGKYYVLRLTQKTEPRERTFEESERSIRVRLAQERLRAKEDELLVSLRQQFPVEVDAKALALVRVQSLDDAGPSPSPHDARPAN